MLITKERKKEIEKLLLEYKNFDRRIEVLDMHINAASNDRPIFDGSLSIEQLRTKKNKIINLKKVVNNAINELSDEEYKIVELRYLQRRKMTWLEIGSLVGFEKNYLCKKNKKILNRIGQFLDSFLPVLKA
ncbi:hypothetical protein CBU02nite_37910 [Clostridium butyricum]|uniref:Uncharacterized protein n=1 Tax=Clostridium butyricum TaxID=1492 RepID=A0A512TSR8_CLOBU|nr:hypothetical protein [Clostridium butyricum]NOW25515.1 DNA-directed RNA polymerase specialized sigma subunit [Clostridium butyricum]GEQ23285.1 hypothetical protein CBU02nite_37910 [Clostridium butyricum]